MATPLELLKARRASTQKQVQGMLTPQGGAGDRIGRGLVTAARALSGGFDDPDEQALATYQEQNKDFEAAQQAQGGGAFTAPFKPDYDPRSDLSGFTSEMRESIQTKQGLEGLAGLSQEDTEAMGLKLAAAKHPEAGRVLARAAQMKVEATATANAATANKVEQDKRTSLAALYADPTNKELQQAAVNAGATPKQVTEVAKSTGGGVKVLL